MADKLSQRVRPNSEAAPWVVEEIKLLESELEVAKAELQKLKNDVLEALIITLDAYENKHPLVANQGQALDGYSALANFIGISEKARELK